LRNFETYNNNLINNDTDPHFLYSVCHHIIDARALGFIKRKIQNKYIKDGNPTNHFRNSIGRPDMHIDKKKYPATTT